MPKSSPQDGCRPFALLDGAVERRVHSHRPLDQARWGRHDLGVGGSFICCERYWPYCCWWRRHALSAQAQSFDQLSKWCYYDATDDQRIQGCNAVVASKRVTGADLAAAFYNRGLAYDNKGQYDRAIEDYDQAIKLNPNDADVFVNRGNAYARKGQNDRAIQDFDQALKLDPNNATV